VTESPPNEIPVRFSGPGKELLTLQLARNVQYRINVTHLSPHTLHRFRLSPSNLTDLDNLSNLSIQFPDTLNLSLQWGKWTKKKVKVRLHAGIRSRLSNRDSVQIIPPECEISGSDILLKRINGVETESLDVVGKDEIEETVRIVSPLESGDILLEPRCVSLRIKRYAGRLIRWDKVPVKVNFARAYKPRKGETIIAEQAYCSVQLEVPPQYADSIGIDDLHAEILIDSPIKNHKAFPVRLFINQYQSQVRIRRIEPESIRVREQNRKD